MPGGRRRGRRGSGVPTLALRTKSFVQPCLLLLLREGAGHGYELMDRLREAGLADGSLSASAVYRGLREMEERGWVTSRWDTTGSGPPRRVYRITREGENVLEEWKREVSEMRTTLDRFLGV
jgi:PadR family transcriptional regulator PadR